MTSTMAKLQKEIIVSALPRVFQDTIELTRHLGISYLWIDALCIKQDEHDKSDWEIESQSMGKVYSSSFLNVAATLSSNGTESLFQDRPRSPVLPSIVNLVMSGGPHKYGIIDSKIWKDEVDDAPLNCRGWVFQERFLARRVLHFGPRQLAWECREFQALETFPNGLPSTVWATLLSKSRIYEMFSKLSTAPGMKIEEEFATTWHKLVENYSKCVLTYPKDKLVAFSGIAKSMETGGDRCVAGIWNASLEYDLAWMRFYSVQAKFPIGKTSIRAPSWSWACVDGEIQFPALSGHHRRFIRNWEFITPPTDGTSTSPALPSIRLEGKRLHLNITWSGTEISHFKIDHFHFQDEFQVHGVSIDFDGAEDEAQEQVRKASLLPTPVRDSAHVAWRSSQQDSRSAHISTNRGGRNSTSEQH